MIHHLKCVLVSGIDYIRESVEMVKPHIIPIIGVVTTALSKLFNLAFCPHGDCFAVVTLLTLVVVDMITKMIAEYQLKKRTGDSQFGIDSSALWEGARIKLTAYFLTAVVTSLIVRVTIVPVLPKVIAGVVYGTLILREFISTLENLTDAGANMKFVKSALRSVQTHVIDKASKEIEKIDIYGRIKKKDCDKK